MEHTKANTHGPVDTISLKAKELIADDMLMRLIITMFGILIWEESSKLTASKTCALLIKVKLINLWSMEVTGEPKMTEK